MQQLETGAASRLRLARLLVPALLLIGLLAGPAAAQAADTAYNGRAAVVQAQLLGLQPVVLADTGYLPSSGGAQEASLLSASVPGLLTANVLHASTIGQGNQTRSEASVADVDLTAGGNHVTADFLMARATAKCGPGGASFSGSSDVAVLTINGQRIAVTGEPNQTVALPGGGKVVINEQTSTGGITVNALHVIVPGVADVVISSAQAGVNCASPPPCAKAKDFVTGGGWITTPSGSRGTFGVGGGIKNDAFWGHLTYIDHGTGMKVHGTAVTAYTVLDQTTRRIDGNAQINGVTGTYSVTVRDAGEPGRQDTFDLKLSNGYQATGTLNGGNIQLHKAC
jgi:hypothetical protein